MTARRAVFACLAALAAWGGAGCGFDPSHVYSPSSANAAKQAQALHTTYREGIAGMYAAMLTNVARVQAQQDLTLQELTDRYADALTTKIPSMTVNQALSRIAAAKGEAEALMQEIIRRTAEALKAAGQTELAAKEAKAAIAAVKKSVEEAEKRVTDWNKQTALCRKVIEKAQALAEAVGAAKTSQEKRAALMEALCQFVNADFTYMDARGKEQKGEALARELVDKFLGPTFDRIGEVPGGKAQVLADAPGLILVIADLGLNLAKIGHAREQAKLAYLDETMAVLIHTYTQVLVAQELLDSALTKLNGLGNAEGLGKQRLATVLADLRAKALTKDDKAATVWPGNKDDKAATVWPGNEVAELLYHLRMMGVAECILARHRARFAIAMARVKHCESIELSKLADKAWQALIGAGLDGLVAYHEGGVRPEDVSQMLLVAFVGALVCPHTTPLDAR